MTAMKWDRYNITESATTQQPDKYLAGFPLPGREIGI